jgi:putative ABC transport system substrate-binding protein
VLPPIAKALGVELLLLEAGTPEAIEAALARGSESGAEALFVPGYPHFYAHRARIAELALKYRLPMGGPATQFADSGGLIGYAADFNYRVRRAAELIDKILRGAKPGELPFEQPTRFQLVVNMKSAKALGITVSPEVLLRADRVIE